MQLLLIAKAFNSWNKEKSLEWLILQNYSCLLLAPLTVAELNAVSDVDLDLLTTSQSDTSSVYVLKKTNMQDFYWNYIH